MSLKSSFNKHFLYFFENNGLHRIKQFGSLLRQARLEPKVSWKFKGKFWWTNIFVLNRCTCRYVSARFWSGDGSQNWYIWFQNSKHSREERWTKQLHFTNFVDNEEISICSDLTKGMPLDLGQIGCNWLRMIIKKYQCTEDFGNFRDCILNWIPLFLISHYIIQHKRPQIYIYIDYWLHI